MLTTREYMDIMREQVEAGKTGSFPVSGNSMSPFLIHGRDTVYFSKPTRALKRGDIVFFRRDDGSYVMHRIYKRDTDGFYIIGDNQTEMEGPVRDDRIFAIVTRAKRKGKLITPASPLWFIFAHIWINMIPFRHAVIDLYTRVNSK